jgi:hypothetical protein
VVAKELCVFAGVKFYEKRGIIQAAQVKEELICLVYLQLKHPYLKVAM